MSASRTTVKVEFGPEDWKQGLKALGLVVLACFLGASPLYLILAAHFLFFA